jgi:hypothetical protein
MRKRRVLRFCLWGCGKFCLGCTNLLLALLALFQAVLLGCILSFETIPLPAPLVRAVADRALPKGLTFEWETLTSTIGGHLVLTGGQLRDAETGNLVLEIPRAHLDLDLVAPLFGGPLPLEAVEIEDLALYGSPASGTGGSASILRIPHLAGTLNGRNLILHRALAHNGAWRMRAQGSYYFEPSRSDEAPSTPRDWRFFWNEATEQLSALENRLRSIEDPFVDLTFRTPEDNRDPVLDVILSAVGATYSDLRLRGIILNSNNIDLKRRTLRGAVDGFVQSAEWTPTAEAPPELAGTGLHLALRGSPFEIASWTLPDKVHLRARLTAADAPPLTIAATLPLYNLANEMRTDTRLSFAGVRAQIAVAHLRDSGDTRFTFGLQGDIDPLLALPHLGLQEVAEATTFSDRFELAATARFGQDFVFERTDFSLRLGDFRTKENRYNDVRLRGAATRERLLVGPIEAFDADGQWAYGYYVQNLVDQTYRILAEGAIHARRLDSLLPSFYVKLWDRIDPGPNPVQADVDVLSRWGDPTSTTALVAAKGQELAYKGAPVEDLHLWLWQATGFVELMELRASTAAGGALDGWISLLYPPKESTLPFRTALDVETTLPLETLAAVFGDTIHKIGKIVQPSEAPHLALRGTVDEFPDEHIEQSFELSASTQTTVTVGGFPLDWLELSAVVNDEGFTLAPVRAGVAGGETLADVTLTYGETENASDRIALTAHLQEANYSRVHKMIEEYLAESTEETEDATTGAEKIVTRSPPSERKGEVDNSPTLDELPTEEQGELNLYLEVAGPIDRWDRYVGNGKLEITDAPLGQISLLGGLTQLFSNTFEVSVGSFRLDTVRTDLVFEPGFVGLPNLELRGPSTRIDTEGRVAIPSGQLDFDARVFFLNTENPSLASLFGLLLRPLGHAFEVSVRGPASDPSWRFKRNPLNLLRPAEPPLEAAPEANPESPPEDQQATQQQPSEASDTSEKTTAVSPPPAP